MENDYSRPLYKNGGGGSAASTTFNNGKKKHKRRRRRYPIGVFFLSGGSGTNSECVCLNCPRSGHETSITSARTRIKVTNRNGEKEEIRIKGTKSK